MAKIGQGVRSLDYLYQSGSTSRVLNLAYIHHQQTQSNLAISAPFFENPNLNRAFLIKHHLRADERDHVDIEKPEATKLVIPLDRRDMKYGGRYVFIGARNWKQELHGFIGVSSDSPDIRLLEHIERLPSFDAFLLKSWLKNVGHAPDDAYFQLNETYTKNLHDLMHAEMATLVSIAIGDTASGRATDVLLGKIFAASAEHNDLDPLRQTLRMGPDQFEECLFSWRGFLYYKNTLKDILLRLPTFGREFNVWTNVRQYSSQQIEQLNGLKREISALLITEVRLAGAIIKQYDEAYIALTSRQDPVGFKDFLLGAPDLFIELGASIGRVSHTLDYWRFCERARRKSIRNFEDDLALLAEFAKSLGSTLQ